MDGINRFRSASISLIVSVTFITQLFPFGNAAFGFSPGKSSRSPRAAAVSLPPEKAMAPQVLLLGPIRRVGRTEHAGRRFIEHKIRRMAVHKEPRADSKSDTFPFGSSRPGHRAQRWGRFFQKQWRYRDHSLRSPP